MTTQSAPAIAITLDSAAMTRGDLAAYFRVSIATIGRWQAAGMPTEFRRVRTVRFDLRKVQAWLKESEPSGAEQSGQRNRGRPRNINRTPSKKASGTGGSDE